MKKKLLTLCLLASTFFSNAQNVGINNPTPQFPLSFNAAVGNKISLWSDGTATHYGLGIQNGLLQMYSKNAADNIVFGYGSSTAFTPRMHVVNAGEYGMILNGRIVLRNGTVPLDIDYGPGIWLNRADNISVLGFMGTQNNQNMGFYGGPGGWGLTYDAVNSRVGIGNDNPAYLLDVSNRIRIRSGGNSTVSAGLWLNNNANTEAAFIGMEDDTHVGIFGTGTGWRFGMNTATGALKINGSEGQPGQVLQSNGSGAPGSWTNAGNIIKSYYYTYACCGYQDITDAANWVEVPTSTAFNINTTVKSRLIISANFIAAGPFCPAGCGAGCANITIEVDGNLVTVPVNAEGITKIIASGNSDASANISNYFYDVNPGAHIIKLKVRRCSSTGANNVLFFKVTQATILALPID